MADYSWLRIKFTSEEWDVVNRPVNCENAGGHQRFLRALLPRVNRETLEVDLSPAHLVTLANYNQKSGGYQTRERCIQAAVDRARATA